MRTWHGHRRVTTEALLSVFDRLLAGATTLSPAEQTLYTTCELWAAVVTRTLVGVLRRDPDDSLRSAAKAFATIGAHQVAATLRRGADDVAVAGTATRRRACLAAVEDRLVCTDDAVDLLIAGYARRYLRGGASAISWPSPDVEVAPGSHLVH